MLSPEMMRNERRIGRPHNRKPLVHDADTLDTLGYRAQWTASRTQTLRNVKRAHITSAFPPFAFSDSVTRVRFTLSDRMGWSAAARSLYVKTRFTICHGYL